MDVHFEVLAKGHSPQALLEENGWRVAEDGADHFTASHPDVEDQPVARNRLQKMGLLTSVRLRIEFGPSVN
jgi:hypothetical protein